MCMKPTLLSLAVLAASCAAAESFVLPPQGVSPYADTEVSTNVALRALGDGPGRKVLDLSLALLGTPSNCLQVAFGRDADGNGVLDASEAETVYGWRAGRFFVEDVAGGRRVLSDPVAGEAGCELRVHVEAGAGDRLRRASLTCGGAPAFAELVRTRPTGLLRGSWDMARVTRRGVGEPPSDWGVCALESLGLAVMVR